MTDAASPPRITYLAPGDVLIPRVARQCVMRFCEALAEAGADARLVALDVRLQHDEPTRSRDLWDVYGIEHRFPLHTIPSLLRQDSSERAVGAHRLVGYGAWGLWRTLTAGRRGGPVTFYFRNARSVAPLFALRRAFPGRIRLVLELHTPLDASRRRLAEALDGIVCISAALANDLRERFRIDSSRVLVAHTGVNLDRLDRLRVGRDEARRRLGLPGDRPLAVYTGKVHRESREVGLLLDTAARLAPPAELVLVGGRDDQVSVLRERLERSGARNVRLPGFVSPAEVHEYQLAADVLVSYYPADIAFNDYRSPAKLVEYLAAGRPIVAADYRSTHEIVTPEVGVLVPPERPDLLARAVSSLLNDPGRAAAMGRAAIDAAEGFTWRERARRVLEFVDALPPRR